MSVKAMPTRRVRVIVPEDVRRACAALCETKRPDDERPGVQKAAQLLKVASCTFVELVAPGGAVQAVTLARVVARLEELKRGAA